MPRHWPTPKCGRNVKLRKEQRAPIYHYWLHGSVDMHGVFEVYPTRVIETNAHSPFHRFKTQTHTQTHWENYWQLVLVWWQTSKVRGQNAHTCSYNARKQWQELPCQNNLQKQSYRSLSEIHKGFDMWARDKSFCNSSRYYSPS